MADAGPVAALTSTRPYLIRALHAWMEDNGLTPHVLVDATAPGVVVPADGVRDGRVILNLSSQATSGLELGNDALRFAARFGARQLAVTIPMAAVLAVFARENGRGMSFTDDPTDDPGPPPATQPTPGSPAPPRRRPRLKVVK